MRPWLAKETQEKVHILGADYKNTLLQLVDPENLPVTLGGTCSCGDEPNSCQLMNTGPWMEGREERRQKWLAGERKSPGLNLEDDPIASESGLRKVSKTHDHIPPAFVPHSAVNEY